MYKSLKQWLNIPIVIKPFIKRSGTGQKIYGDPIAAKCYAVGKIETITDDKGVEVISKIQLYFDGNVKISSNDAIIFNEAEKSILSIGYLYDTKGSIDLKVVYI